MTEGSSDARRRPWLRQRGGRPAACMFAWNFPRESTAAIYHSTVAIIFGGSCSFSFAKLTAPAGFADTCSRFGKARELGLESGDPSNARSVRQL